jgi:hypothetical protein
VLGLQAVLELPEPRVTLEVMDFQAAMGLVGVWDILEAKELQVLAHRGLLAVAATLVAQGMLEVKDLLAVKAMLDLLVHKQDILVVLVHKDIVAVKAMRADIQAVSVLLGLQAVVDFLDLQVAKVTQVDILVVWVMMVVKDSKDLTEVKVILVMLVQLAQCP